MLVKLLDNITTLNKNLIDNLTARTMIKQTILLMETNEEWIIYIRMFFIR